MRYWFLHAAAWIRGLFYRWPHQGPIPEGYGGVSCALRDVAECRAMYEQGWIPHRFQRIPKRYGCGRVSRLFLVPLTADGLAYEAFPRDNPPIPPTEDAT